MGKQGVLPCQAHCGGFSAILWNKGPTYTESKNIIQLDTKNNVGHRSGPGYIDGSFNISASYSLIVNDAKIQDEGRYFCIVMFAEKSSTSRNSTNVSLFGKLRFTLAVNNYTKFTFTH